MRFPALALALLSVAWTKDGTVYTTDGTQSDVQSALDDSSAGDTVSIPAGSYNWTCDTKISMDDARTLAGAGGGTGAGDTRIILDAPVSSAVGTLFEITTTDGNDPARVQSMRIERGTATNNTSTVFTFQGTGDVALEDVDVINPPSSSPANRVNGAVYGVWSDSYFEVNGKTMIWFFNGEKNRDGTTWGDWGDLTWLDDPDFGSGNAFHLEDCTFRTATASRQNVTDFYGGAKAVIRYCDFDDTYVSSHGHGDGSGRSVGPRILEWYQNTVRNSLGDSPTSPWHRNRGGPEIFAFNTIYDYEGTAHVLSYYPADDDHGRHGFFPTLGRDRWTVQDTGTTDTPSNQTEIVDASKSWTTDEHAGRVVLVTIDSRYTKMPSESATLSSLDNSTEELTTSAAHGWSTGEVVVVDRIDAGGNLTDNEGNTWNPLDVEQRGRVAAVNVVDSDTFTLERWGSTVDLETLTGTPTVRRIYGGLIDSVDTGADTIDTAQPHDLSNDDMVWIDAQDDGDVPAPLLANDGDNEWNVYFVIVTDSDTIQLAAEPGGSAIDLTSTASDTTYVVHVSELINGLHKNPYGHLKMVVVSNTATVLTGQGGTINVWLNADWFLDGLSYEIIDVDVGAGMPGAGKWRSVPGIGPPNETFGGYGESDPNSPSVSEFTTDYASDANRIEVLINSEWDGFDGGNDEEGFNRIDNVVRFESTGTLPAGLSADTDYYVIEWDDDAGGTGANEIEVSTTEGGGAVTLTSDGTGTHTAYIWMDPEIEGVYNWGNTNPDASLSSLFSFNPPVREDVHGFGEVGGYDGSTGMGTGLLAARPASPSLVNTAYYATDTEILYAWRDTTGNGSGDTWVNHWSEYTYPHPLRELSGGGGGGGGSTATSASAGSVTIGP